MTDRVELTDAEFATVPHLSQLDSYADSRDIKKAVERLLAARVQALTADYKTRLQELAACTLEARSEAVAARAELAAANARCADVRCVCGCTWDNHEDAGVRCTSHESCLGFRADLGEGWASYAAEQERNAALQATLDRVTAVLASVEAINDGGWQPMVENILTQIGTDLRAALTPEGKP